MPVATVSPFDMKGDITRGDTGVERDSALNQLQLKYLDLYISKKKVSTFL